MRRNLKVNKVGLVADSTDMRLFNAALTVYRSEGVRGVAKTAGAFSLSRLCSSLERYGLISFSDRIKQTPYGPKIWFNWSQYLEVMFVLSWFEPEFIDRFRSTTAELGGVFVDVGAYHGFYSLLYLSDATKTGTVEAFEPVPANRERFRQNVSLNGFADCVTLNDCALMDAHGVKQMNIGKPAFGQSTLGGRMRSEITDESIDVPVRRFDDEYEVDRPVDVMKIDVEGAECEVISGSIETLRTHKPHLFIETHEKMMPSFDTSLSQLVALLEEAGYERAYDIQNGEYLGIDSIDSRSNGVGRHLHIVGDPSQ